VLLALAIMPVNVAHILLLLSRLKTIVEHGAAVTILFPAPIQKKGHLV
jgi:hypothetical protein